MAAIDMIIDGEQVDATVTNRPLGDVLEDSGYERDGSDFGGFAPLAYAEREGEAGVTDVTYPYGDVRRYGGVGDGVAVNTTAAHAARTAAGVDGTVTFAADPLGTTTYLVGPLGLNIAGQRWVIERGVTVKLTDATNQRVLNVTADGVSIEGDGTIDGNRTNQSSGSYGVSFVGCSRGRMRGVTVQNCFSNGLLFDGMTGMEVRHCRFTNNATSGNDSQIATTSSAGDSSDIVIEENVFDGTTPNNGGVKISASSVAINRISVSRNVILCGGSASYDTQGVEVFKTGSATIEDVDVSGNIIVGEGSNHLCTAISVGGTNVNVTDNLIHSCFKFSVEIANSNAACRGNITYLSGRIGTTGPGTNLIISGNTQYQCTTTSYAIYTETTASPLDGLQIVDNTIYDPAGPGIVSKATTTNAMICRNRIVACAGQGISIEGGSLTDARIEDNSIDGTGGPANMEGILLANTIVVTRVKIGRNQISNFSRYGVSTNGTSVNVQIRENDITGCLDGIRTAGSAQLVIKDNYCYSNSGTGIILAGSPTLVTLKDNRCWANTTAQINLGGATFTSRRGNQYTTGGSEGTAVLAAGTATVSTTEVQASDRIHLTRTVTGGTVGHLSVGTITAGTSFVINSSSATDTSTIFWEIVH